MILYNDKYYITCEKGKWLVRSFCWSRPIRAKCKTFREAEKTAKKLT